MMGTTTEDRPQGVRLESGQELRAAVESMAVERALPFCDVTGFGRLKSVVLAGETAAAPITLKGAMTLLDLKGRVRLAGKVAILDLICTVAYREGDRIELLGGALVKADIDYVELTFTPLHHIGPPCVAREASEAGQTTTNSDLSAKALATAEAGQSADKDRWAQAIAESERIQEDRDESNSEDELPGRSDTVIHRQFGECTVLRIGDDHITLRKPDRRVVQLGLAVLRFTRGTSPGKHSVFNVEVRPKGAR
jgi:predicted DNA-binding protein with PD1-like motif